jgi:uncharacterized protein YbjT (DUF2867 family)
MTTILVTGGTGCLGRPTVARLRAAGHDVRSLSRRTGPVTDGHVTGGHVTGDLLTGVGIQDAVAGVATVLHLATGRDRKDVQAARTLLDAAEAAGVEHLVLISIVGIEEIPLAYYRDKVVIERLVTDSAVPHTILRSTQFHNLVDEILSAQRFSPILLAPKQTLQPIAVEDVADRLVELAGSDPAGRVADIGGPQRRTFPELAKVWAAAKGTRRPVWPVKLPGKVFAAYAAGHNLVPGPPYGRLTFEDYLGVTA